MRSRRAASPATDPDALPGARARRAKKLPGAGLRAAAVLAALVVAVAVIGLDASPAAAQSDMTYFITTWQTTGANETITIPGTGAYTVDWGDGTVNAAVTGTQAHTYNNSGTYTVSISGGLTRINLGSEDSDNVNDAKLQSIGQWGNMTWSSMEEAFRGASNMRYNATDIPNLAGVTSTSHMFRGATSFDGDISSWNTSSVQNMRSMFSGASAFNQPLNSWDVSAVTNMAFMFYDATSFNQDLDDWKVSGVTSMENMFGAGGDSSAFNGNVSTWDVSAVTDMRSMFSGASAFDQPLNGWDVSKVTAMPSMFNSATSFDQPLNGWDVSMVTDMGSMFAGASAFNHPLNGWDVSAVTDMDRMFFNAVAFNQPLNDWDVSAVTDMRGMFTSASAFNQPLNGWDVSKVTDMRSMFTSASAFNQPLNGWDVSKVTDMFNMFHGATLFQQNLGEWYVVLDGATINLADTGNAVGSISAQNSILNGHSPTYGLGPDSASQKFAISGNDLQVKPDEDYSGETYDVTITATGTGLFGTDNQRTVVVTVTDTTPTVNVGPAQAVMEGAQVSMPWVANDPDGGQLEYLWSQSPAEPPIMLDNQNSSPTTFTAPRVNIDTDFTFTLAVTNTADLRAVDTVTIKVRDVPITVSSATYNPGSGTITITFNQDINGTPDYSKLHVRGSGSDSGGIALSDVDDKSYLNRTITATLSSGQQEQYDALQGQQLDVEAGAVTDAEDVGIEEMLDVTIRGTSSGKRSSTPPPAVDLNALASRGVDIPPHIAELASSRGESDPIAPAVPDGTFDYPLVINGRGYLLDNPFNTLVPHTVMTGQPIEIMFTVYSQNDLAHFALYLNLQGNDVDYSNSDTHVTYRNDGTVRVLSDPHGYISNATVTISQDKQQPEKKIVTVTIQFDEPMGQTNMVAYLWDTEAKSTRIGMIGALDVMPAPVTVDPEPGAEQNAVDPEPAAMLDAVDPEPAGQDSADSSLLAIRTWSGFEPESITDAQLLVSLGLDYPDADIPGWVMTELGPLAAKGDITVGEFVTALTYVLDNA